MSEPPWRLPWQWSISNGTRSTRWVILQTQRSPRAYDGIQTLDKALAVMSPVWSPCLTEPLLFLSVSSSSRRRSTMAVDMKPTAVDTFLRHWSSPAREIEEPGMYFIISMGAAVGGPMCMPLLDCYMCTLMHGVKTSMLIYVTTEQSFILTRPDRVVVKRSFTGFSYRKAKECLHKKQCIILLSVISKWCVC